MPKSYCIHCAKPIVWSKEYGCWHHATPKLDDNGEKEWVFCHNKVSHPLYSKLLAAEPDFGKETTPPRETK